MENLCSQCGHLLDRHQFTEYGHPPPGGWMKCPVAGCTCYSRWSMRTGMRLDSQKEALATVWQEEKHARKLERLILDAVKGAAARVKIGGAGVQWQVDLSLGTRRCQIACFNYGDLDVKRIIKPHCAGLAFDSPASRLASASSCVVILFASKSPSRVP